jgi:hypothetical protein
MRDPMSMAGSLWRLGVSLGMCFLGFLIASHFTERRSALFMAVLISPLTLPWLLPGVLGFFPALVRFSRAMSLEKWQGRYYEFEGRQVRVEEVDGAIWIALKDVRKAARLSVHHVEIARFNPDDCLILPESRTVGVNETALLAWLSALRGRQVAAFRLWLERDVLPPIHRRRNGERLVPPAFEAPAEESPKE